MAGVRFNEQQLDPFGIGELLRSFDAASLSPFSRSSDRPGSSSAADAFARSRVLDPQLRAAASAPSMPDSLWSSLLARLPAMGFGRDLGALGNAQFSSNPSATDWNPFRALTSSPPGPSGPFGPLPPVGSNPLAPTPTAPPPKPRDVKRAEIWLKQLGYHPGKVDGQLSNASKDALREYQGALGLNASGNLDARTLRNLKSTAKRVKKYGKGYLTPGMKGARVKKLQQRLARLGDFQGSPDGIYGQSTVDAVHTFRGRHKSLDRDIKSFGKKAQSALRNELDNMAHDPYRTRVKPAGQARLDRLARTEAEDNGIGAGSPREVIAHVQRQLTAAGYNPNRTDGRWDQHTEAMLHQFQRRSDLPETDRVGPGTWSRLGRSTMETTSATSPKQMKGEHSRAVLRTERLLKKAGLNPGKIDGIYTSTTERAADKIRKLFHAAKADGVSARTIKQIKQRIKQLHSFVKPVDARLSPGSEFLVPDAEGAPSSHGGSFHAAKDWFAPGGTKVRSPIAGKIVEVRPTLTRTGQVFGGTVKVQGKDGKVWVFRHVDPRDVHVGQRVKAGQMIARVTDWLSGPDHTHVELWKTLSGGYRLENMIDPMKYLKRFL